LCFKHNTIIHPQKPFVNTKSTISFAFLLIFLPKGCTIKKKGVNIVDNKSIFATNLKRQMDIHHKTRRQICKDLGFSYYTFSDWVNGKKYPRMDKVELLAKYFGVLKSDLIEERTEAHRQMQKNNDIITDAVVKMRVDSDFLYLVECLMGLDAEKQSAIKQMALALQK
jgi:transcriptional regulator with XRE-family HTH domain